MIILINPFATGDAHMRQHFHCLQWYAGSERVKKKYINKLNSIHGSKYIHYTTYISFGITVFFNTKLILCRVQ